MNLSGLSGGWTSTFFGNASRSDSLTLSPTSTSNTDKRQVVDAGGVGISSDSSTVNFTQIDPGAFDLAKSSNAMVMKSIDQVINLAAGNLKLQTETTQGIGQAYATAADVSSGNRMLVWGVLGIVAAVTAAVLIKRK